MQKEDPINNPAHQGANNLASQQPTDRLSGRPTGRPTKRPTGQLNKQRLEPETPKMIQVQDTRFQALRQQRARPSLSRNASPKIPENIPAQGRDPFVGRSFELEDLHQRLQQTVGSVVAIAGISGVGKTAIAIQYAHQYLRQYSGGVCWLNGNGDVCAQLIQFAQQTLGMAPPDEDTQQTLSLPGAAADYLLRWRRTGTVLLIFDEVESALEIQPLLRNLPQRFYSLLTVSQPQAALNNFLGAMPLDVMELGLLGREDSLALLNGFVGARVTTAQPAAKSLCKKVGYFPLAVCLLGRYLLTHASLSVGEVSQALTKQMKALPRERPDLGISRVELSATELNKAELALAERGIWAAYELCWRHLDDAAQQLGQLLSFFETGEIPWALVTQVARQAGLDGAQLNAAMHQIQGFIQRSEGDTLRLHSLSRNFLVGKRIQYSAQRLSGQTHSAQERWQEAYAIGLASFVEEPSQGLTPKDMSKTAPAMAHLRALLGRSLEQVPDAQLGPLFSGVIRFYSSLAVFPEALAWAERGIAVLRHLLGDNHLSIATALNNLAHIYTVQKRFNDAEELYAQALSISQQHLGDDHPEIAKSCNNLANVYFGQNRFEKAEKLYLHTLESTQRNFGPDHPKVASSLNNLGLLYSAQGRYNEAETLYSQALTISKERLGEDHASLASSYSNLASVYVNQGRLDDAEPLYKQDLAITRRTYGDEHIAVATRLNNLALLYKSQNRFGEAEPLYKQALDITQRSLGHSHPAVAKNLNNLANVYSGQDRFREAEPLYQDAIKIARRSLGADHPDVVTSLNNLALLYKTQCRFSEAEPLYAATLEITEKQLTENPAQLVTSLNNLASVYTNQGYYNEAEPLYKQALQRTERSEGATSYDVASSLNNLGQLYKAQGRLSAAETLCLQVLAMSRSGLGEQHPIVGKSLSNLGFVYKQQARLSEAESMFEKALAVTENTLGNEHPEVTMHRAYLLAIRRSRRRRRLVRIFRLVFLAVFMCFLIPAGIGLLQSASAGSFAWFAFVLFAGLTVWLFQSLILK